MIVSPMFFMACLLRIIAEDDAEVKLQGGYLTEDKPAKRRMTVFGLHPFEPPDASWPADKQQAWVDDARSPEGSWYQSMPTETLPGLAGMPMFPELIMSGQGVSFTHVDAWRYSRPVPGDFAATVPHLWHNTRAENKYSIIRNGLTP